MPSPANTSDDPFYDSDFPASPHVGAVPAPALAAFAQPDNLVALCHWIAAQQLALGGGTAADDEGTTTTANLEAAKRVLGSGLPQPEAEYEEAS